MAFYRKRDGRAKARSCVGGHRQVAGRDFYEFKNYTSVLHCRDNRILLALAASNSWHVFQSDIQQAFLSGKLDDADIFINPFHGVPCSPGKVLKLRKAVYGLRRAPAKFIEELLSFFQQEGFVPANDSQTVLSSGVLGVCSSSCLCGRLPAFY